MFPTDGLHLFGDGLLRSENAWLLYVFFNMGMEVEQLNGQLNKCKAIFPKDVRIPPFHKGLKNGNEGGKPKSSMTTRMSGSQQSWFTLKR